MAGLLDCQFAIVAVLHLLASGVLIVIRKLILITIYLQAIGRALIAGGLIIPGSVVRQVELSYLEGLSDFLPMLYEFGGALGA